MSLRERWRHFWLLDCRPEIVCRKGDDCWCDDVRECGNAEPGVPAVYEVRCPDCSAVVAVESGDAAIRCREESAAFRCEQCALRRHRIWYPVEEQK